MTVNIPNASVPIIRMGDKPVLIEKPWYQLLQALADGTNSVTQAFDGNVVDLAAASAEVSGILPVQNGGTGKSSVTAYMPLAGGTTTTGVLQSIAAGSTAGWPLVYKGSGSLPAFEQLTFSDALCGVIESPQARDYVIGANMPFDFTVDSLTTFSSAGTCTIVAKKNTTAITGLSNSVSTSRVTNTATAGNVFSAGDDVRFTISSVSSCEMAVFCLKITRAIP